MAIYLHLLPNDHFYVYPFMRIYIKYISLAYLSDVQFCALYTVHIVSIVDLI